MKINYDPGQQRILIAIGILERITMDEPLDVQVNIIKAFLNGTIKGANLQTKRDDILSAIQKLQYISNNLETAAEFLKHVAVSMNDKLKAEKPEPVQTPSGSFIATILEE